MTNAHVVGQATPARGCWDGPHSHHGRALRLPPRFGNVRYLQTNAAINPGNSGGALLDLSGRLIGVTTWGLRADVQGVALEGLNFAIATETVLEFLDGRVWPAPTPQSTPAPRVTTPAPEPPRSPGS